MMILEYDNKILKLHQWAEITGLKPKLIYQRVHKLGWSIEKALTTKKLNPFGH